MIKTFVSFLILILFMGCSRNIPTLEQRHETLKIISKNNINYKEEIIPTNYFDIFTVQDIDSECKSIHVYIEGDGLSWITRRIISTNPTPINPVSFKLMNQDKSSCKIYLARPCQYTKDKLCSAKYWTTHRFNSNIIESYDNLLNKIKKKYKNESFSLIGYSGGAAIASLLANKREDISTLITVAGNLDTKLWEEIKNLSPLYGSLNPSDYTSNLQNIRQYHIIGSRDNVIPKEILFSYTDKFKNKDNINYKIIDATHSCCYENEFKKLIEGIK